MTNIIFLSITLRPLAKLFILLCKNLRDKLSASSGANARGANDTLAEERDKYERIVEFKVPSLLSISLQ